MAIKHQPIYTNDVDGSLSSGQSTAHDLMAPNFFSIPVDIASGVRLSARAQSDGNDATDRLFDLVLYGVGP